MIKKLRLTALLCIIILLGACTSGCATYTKNRANDFADIFDINLGICMFTKSIRTPPIYLSAQATRMGHFAVGSSAVGRLGFYGGSWHAWSESNSALPVAPFVYFSESSGAGDPQAEEFWKYDLFDRWDWFLGLPSNYRDIWTPGIEDAIIGAKMDSPVHWFDISLQADILLPAMRVGLSPGELIDFVAGIFFLDLAGDDGVSEENIEAHLTRLLEKAETGGLYARQKALIAAHRYCPHSAAWKILHTACTWEQLRLRGMAWFLMTEGSWTNADTLPIYLRLLKDPDPRFRMNAISQLGKMGRSADLAIAPLILILNRTDRPAERGLAAGAIGNIAVAIDNSTIFIMAVRILGQHLNDTDENVRTHCEVALETLGPRAAPAINSLLRELRSKDASRRYVALKLLGRIGPRAGSALPAIRRTQNDPNTAVRDAAAWAIRRIER